MMETLFLLSLCVSVAALMCARQSAGSERQIVRADNAPKAIGPYAQAVKYGDMLFVSGMIAINPKTNEFSKGSFEEQTALVLENIKAVVEAAGFTLETVLKATVFLKDLNDFQKFNEIYATYFGAILPARETVQVAALPKDALVEISVICGK
ncbi:MAG: RidA family protein [Deltaproteobacteria bacterium]|nr:RidA family protein [Deltaproteobacteria bacterium]